MKTTFHLLLATTVLFCTSCFSKSSKPFLELDVLVDTTDTMMNVSSDEVKSIFNWEEFLWLDHQVTVRELCDVNSGISNTLKLPCGNPRNQTEQTRKLQVRAYLQSIDQQFTSPVFSNNRKSASHLYYPICEQLNDLSKSKAVNRVCIISSDLHENSPLLSVYNTQDSLQLLYHPELVIQKFEAECPLEDLTGIQVLIVHRASAQTNLVFSHMARLYQHLLSAHGAKVAIRGSFNPTDLILIP
ncbi:MAG: hypothetical protein GC181_10735 [Bacteroidetes bacterium]|nr:hypothetical protein [Bacteroidota bacterium]